MRKSNEIVNWHAFSAICSRLQCSLNENGTEKSWQNEALLWIQCNSIWQRKLSSSRFDFTIGAQIVVDIHKHAHLCGFSHWIGTTVNEQETTARKPFESWICRYSSLQSNPRNLISGPPPTFLPSFYFIFFVMLAHEELRISSHFVPLGENQLVQVKRNKNFLLSLTENHS